MEITNEKNQDMNKRNNKSVSQVNSVNTEFDMRSIGFLKPIYTNKDMMDMLGCTEKTLRKYRDEGYLTYSRCGDKYFYSPKNIILFLEKTSCDMYLS